MPDKPDDVLRTFIRCSQDALTAPEAAACHPYTSQAVFDGDARVGNLPDGSDLLVCRETWVTPKTQIGAAFAP